MIPEKYTKPLLWVVVVVLIAGSIYLLESRKAGTGNALFLGGGEIAVLEENERVFQKEELYERAKEISSPDGFINADGITIGELVGEKIILVDFWTYSCINCQRTLPYLNSWHQKYADDGLVIIGLHTPEFDFEKDYDNVARAVEKFGVRYPVVLDNDFSTWRSYRNRYWPRKYLIDIDGFIVYDHIGEGAYEETEAKIVELLNERSRILGAQMVETDESVPEEVAAVDFSRVGSPEMYFGSSRIEHIGNLPTAGCLQRSCDHQRSDPVDLNSYQLSGSWRTDRQRAVLESTAGSVFLRFSASKVNLVAGAEATVRAEIYLDGKPVGEFAGADVKNGIVIFSTHDLYNLIDLKGAYGEHELEIRFLEGGVSAFAFTFG